MRTVVKLNLNEESQEELKAYANRVRRTGIPKNEFHSTIYYSEDIHICKDKKSAEKLMSSLPIEISPNYSLEIFGRNCLVLRYENSNVLELEEFLKEIAIGNSKMYGKFNPHITLVKEFNRGHLKFLSVFEKKLIFDSFSWDFYDGKI